MRRSILTWAFACSMFLTVYVIAEPLASGTTYADSRKTFAIVGGPQWARNQAMEQAKPNIALALSQAAQQEGQTLPSIFVMEIAEKPGKPSNLDLVLQSTADRAKTNHPDQAGMAKIEKTKLDGVEARSVEYRLEVGGKLVHFRTTVAARSGLLYVIQFFCADADFNQKLPDGEAALRSFHWTN